MSYEIVMFRCALRLALALCAFGLTGCLAWAPGTRYPVRYGAVYCDVDTAESRAIREQADTIVEHIAARVSVQSPPRPVRILVFPSLRGMQTYLSWYRPDRYKSHALCLETEDGFDVALHLTGDTARGLRNLRHEMTHYVLASHFFDLPPWIDEGLARYFETGEPYGKPKKEELGLLRPILADDRPVLEDLVTIPAGESFTLLGYAESWALTHYLIHARPQGLERLLRYLKVVRSGYEAGLNFQQIFGKPPSKIEPLWRAHVRALTYGLARNLPKPRGRKDT